MAVSARARCHAPLPDVRILEVMPGNQQRDHPNQQPARECYSEVSTCSRLALRVSLFTVDTTGGRKEGTSGALQHALSCVLTGCQSPGESRRQPGDWHRRRDGAHQGDAEDNKMLYSLSDSCDRGSERRREIAKC